MEPKYFVKYQGKTITLRQFCNITGVRYNTLRNRADRGAELFLPVSKYEEENAGPRTMVNRDGGYTLDELSELYCRFRGDEDELEVLADLACIPRRGKRVKLLREDIINHLKKKSEEVYGK